ncbi:DUF1064 domain-containing protein [Deinococcus alpinitundrae]|uniref:DUF1064 domain-containing protein n=1 Tax=Deinococcus alpinitundrae TaxID=468913 RepID=UPI00137A189F|nr:DUF1064 domain-containing protein [Deinococcus alpinitundrae]
MSRPFAHHKFSAVRTERDRIVFASKAEAARYDQLVLLEKAGDVVGFMRQPVFYLPGGTRYVADFLIFWTGGRVTAEDVKGMETEGFKIKFREVKAAYPWMNFELWKAKR